MNTITPRTNNMYLRLLLGTALVTGLVLAVLLAISAPASQAAGPAFYVTNSLERIPPDAAFRLDRPATIVLSAAGNEYEAAQIDFHGGSTGLTGVDLALDGPLVGEQGNSLPVTSAAFFREHYITVTKPSGGEGLPGTYPDALVPFRNRFTGERISGGRIAAAPFDVAAGRNQPIFVEFYVPPDTAAGLYRGTIQVTAGEAMFAEIPVLLTVRDFSLPAASSERTNFQTFDEEHWIGPAQTYGYGYRSPEHWALARALDEMLLRHRITPTGPMGIGFDYRRDGTIITGDEQAEKVEAWAKRPEVSQLSLGYGSNYPFKRPYSTNRQRAINYLRSSYDWFAARGLAGKLFVLPGDEPSSAKELKKVKRVAEVAREANPNLRVEMTLDISDRKTQDILLGVINAPVACYCDFDVGVAAARQAAGDEIWTYTAVVQETENPTPYWQIDFPLLNYRVATWINFRHGVDGLLYWTTDLWRGMDGDDYDPWTDACSYDVGWACFNGEGLLVYPGKDVNYAVPKGAYGEDSPATVYGAVPSIRLKALRDSLEDYEYLVLAAKADPVATDLEVLKVACGGEPVVNCFLNWDKDPLVLLEARDQLAEIIEKNTQEEHIQPVEIRK